VVRAVSFRIAGGQLAISGKKGSHRLPVSRLRRTDHHRNARRHHRKGRSGGIDRPCIPSRIQMETGCRIRLKYNAFLPVGRTFEKLGAVRSCNRGWNFPIGRITNDVFQQHLQKTNGPGLLLQYENIFG
jgi:hypothetical protein